ncbi:sigma-70 family RNA polymerase sigma factor [Anaerosporobacter sp.]|uniref:sigma-70 family RNA polymerase sigma factor n=1 Tax=Anaerosporobacter sp. TaxID=1872529 RepID=UPI00286EE6DF|nr:sigma-70 family RNA polymerase sigma factor [Anaerosporobacter sp.]
MTNEQLVIRIQAGIEIADNMAELYNQNKGMISKLAKKYSSYAEYEDLMQEGYFGLDSAVEHWETSRNVAFITYAVYWIKQAMQRYIENNSIFGVQMQNKIIKYRKFVSTYFNKYGKNPSINESCHYLGMSREQVRTIIENDYKANIQSLDIDITEDGNCSIVDTIAADTDIESAVLDQIQREELKAVIWPLVDSLSEEQSRVIRLRYQDKKTLKETGEMLGNTRKSPERIRVIEEKAMYELRKSHRKRLLQPFIMDYICTYAYRGSVGDFNRTWTSSTENAAMKLIEMEGKYIGSNNPY